MTLIAVASLDRFRLVALRFFPLLDLADSAALPLMPFERDFEQVGVLQVRYGVRAGWPLD